MIIHRRNKKSKIEKLDNECVNLVKIHDKPLSLMDDKAFRNIIVMIPLNSNTRHLINSYNIKKCIEVRVKQIHNRIRKEINGKRICLKINATCMNCPFLGINVQLPDVRRFQYYFTNISSERIIHYS